MNKVTQLDRNYYYRPCQFDNGQTLKCAGFGAERKEHADFYIPHFAKGDDAQFLLPGVVVLKGYHGDHISREYAVGNCILNQLETV